MNQNETLTMTREAAAATSFYLRNNLSAQGQVPFTPPLERCPDIIQSDAPVADFQDVFSTVSSWQQAYNVAPRVEVENYYYLRAMNGGTTPASGSLSLYYAPAQVFMLPSLWKSNLLTTATGAESAALSAKAGQIGVAGDAFLWSPAAPPRDSYYSFVAQYNQGSDPDPLPAVGSWLELAKLIGQTPNLGIRNQAMVEGSQWVRRQQLYVPPGFVDTPITITVSSSGLTGTMVALLADTVAGPSTQPLYLGPQTIASDGTLTGGQFSLPPGYRANLAVQFWNPNNIKVAPGSTLQVTFSYPVSNAQDFAYAVEHGLVNQHWHEGAERAQVSGGVKPKALSIVGQLCFTFAAPTQVAYG